MNYEYLFKIFLIENSAVGKSSLILQFSDQTFSESLLPTIGVDFKTRTFNIKDRLGIMQIWDDAGQERFKTITTTYYKEAHGIILVYDITDLQSFLDIGLVSRQISRIYIEVEIHASESVIMLLVGNKADLVKQRQVTYNEGKKLADRIRIKFIEASAKANTNVESSFITLVSDIISIKDNYNSWLNQFEIKTIKKCGNMLLNNRILFFIQILLII